MFFPAPCRANLYWRSNPLRLFCLWLMRLWRNMLLILWVILSIGSSCRRRSRRWKVSSCRGRRPARRGRCRFGSILCSFGWVGGRCRRWPRGGTTSSRGIIWLCWWNWWDWSWRAGCASYLPKNAGASGCSYPSTFWLRVGGRLRGRF